MDNALMITLLFFVSYFIGSLNTSKILTKIFGYGGRGDISELGSRNAGANNIWRLFGIKAGLSVFAVDIGKGVLIAVLATSWLGFSEAIAILSGVFGMIGHNWPVWFAFKGGKGIAIIAGVILFLNPISYVIAMVSTIALIVVVYRIFNLQVSGLAPFVAIPVYVVSNFGFQYWVMEDLSLILIIALVSVFLVILIRRLNAEWEELKSAPNKVYAFIYLVVYDRATNDPPPLDFANKKRVAR